MNTSSNDDLPSLFGDYLNHNPAELNLLVEALDTLQEWTGWHDGGDTRTNLLGQLREDTGEVSSELECFAADKLKAVIDLAGVLNRAYQQEARVVLEAHVALDQSAGTDGKLKNLMSWTERLQQLRKPRRVEIPRFQTDSLHDEQSSKSDAQLAALSARQQLSETLRTSVEMFRS